MGTRQGNKNAGFEPLLASGGNLLVHGLERALPVSRRDIVGKSSEVIDFSTAELLPHG
jgi:hypothetical protein